MEASVILFMEMRGTLLEKIISFVIEGHDLNGDQKIYQVKTGRKLNPVLGPDLR